MNSATMPSDQVSKVGVARYVARAFSAHPAGQGIGALAVTSAHSRSTASCPLHTCT
ncbi:hypothetical protein ABS642_00820 [Microbacterium sp. A8/3-1]|uniref:Uncharacterized protein n=1 Tax=Microbacterium sp. A8/3-1 TaxID=3160749 RepID=A0AAU7VWC6_9MICO